MNYWGQTECDDLREGIFFLTNPWEVYNFDLLKGYYDLFVLGIYFWWLYTLRKKYQKGKKNPI